MRLARWLVVGVLAVLPGGAAAANATQASLLFSAETARPGDTVLAGVRLKMAKGWHTYWRNGGDSGKATEIEWSLPAGLKAGEVQWPAPEKMMEEDLTTYVYRDEVVLLVPLAVAADVARGTQEITAKVSWLECEVNCVPGEATLRGRFSVGAEAKPSGEAELLQKWQRDVPVPEPRQQARAWWANGTNAQSRSLLVEWTVLQPAVEGDFFPYENTKLEIGGKSERVSAEPGKIRLRKGVKKLEGDWPREMAGLLMETGGGKLSSAHAARLPLTEPETPGSGAGVSTAAPLASAAVLQETDVTRPLWWMFLLAFAGGLILNVMPCVLPVIALKILGFVKQSRDDPGRVRRLGLIYGLGVLASFLVLAGMVVAVQQAGRKASWGMQFGNPVFIVVLTVLVTLVALNLFGLFEVMLGGRALTAAAELSGREGNAGAFFNGVLATALATPCTAPFLSLALGFAFTQKSAVIIVLMFLTVGAGLALPYVLLCMFPRLLSILPKPGAWMEKFKIAMGFPMLATAVWLGSLAQAHYGKRVWWLGLFLVVLALCAWIYGEFVQRGRTRRGLAAVVALVLLLAGYGYALEGQLRWRAPEEAGTPAALQESPDGIPWRAWSRAAVQRARTEGRPVFVDFTADWCVTCQANKKTSIEIASVRAKLKEINAVALLGDYTKVPADITEELQRFRRAGVPLVLVYPKSTNAPPIVLPELLTPSLVLNALQKAGE
jgi:thiol:disulfide interchange protein